MQADARLESAFAALSGEYRVRKNAAETAVCDWQWATRSWFDVRPLHFERLGIAAGRRLRREPPDHRNRVACGLDRDGRVVVERQFNGLSFYETFYTWAADSVEAAHFDYAGEKSPINLLRARMTDNRVVASDMAATHGYSRETYRWDGGLVREIDVRHARRESGVLAPLRPWHTVKAHYSDDGVLQRVELVWPPSVVQRPEGFVEIMFERRGKTIYRNHP